MLLCYIHSRIALWGPNSITLVKAHHESMLLPCSHCGVLLVRVRNNKLRTLEALDNLKRGGQSGGQTQVMGDPSASSPANYNTHSSRRKLGDNNELNTKLKTICFTSLAIPEERTI